MQLEYLAAAFARSSKRFLRSTTPGRVELALDLGSGIGATTALVRDVTNAPRIVGYERSGNMPALSRYYDLVKQLQAHHGQETLIGKKLGALVAGLSGARTTSVPQDIPVAVPIMARLHAMNVATWKADPFMLETHGLSALEHLEGELTRIAAASDLPEGRCVITQVCIERL